MSKFTTRRTVLAGAAALPALAIPPAIASAEADPIIQLIERHKATQIRITDLCALPECDDDEDDIDNAVTALQFEADNIAMEMLATTPTTVAGVASLLDYVYRQEHRHPQAWPEHNWPEGLEVEEGRTPDHPDSYSRSFQHYICRQAAVALADIAARGVA